MRGVLMAFLTGLGMFVAGGLVAVVAFDDPLGRGGGLLASLGLLVIAASVLAWWIMCLVEALRTPTSTWETAELSPVAFVVVLATLNLLGALLYCWVARPLLKAAETA